MPESDTTGPPNDETLWLDLLQLSACSSRVNFLPDRHNVDLLRIVVHRSTDDPVNDRKRSTLCTYLWSLRSKALLSKSPIVTELPPGVKCYVPSPSGNKVAMLCVDRRRGDVEQKFVDVMCGSVLVSSICVDDFHGDFHGNGWFSGLSWDSTEDAFVYVAERKLKRDERAFRRKESGQTPDSKKKRLLEFEDEKDWGELLEDAKRPTLVLFTLKEQHVQVLALPTNMNISCGQPLFRPKSSQVYFIGFPNDAPRKLGIVMCFQRRSDLYMVDTALGFGAVQPDRLVNLTPATAKDSDPVSVRCPRFSPGGEALVFLGSPQIRTHQGASNIYMILDLSTPSRCQLEVLVNGKEEVAIDSGDRFPGLFTQALPQKCFAVCPNGLKLMFGTAWHSTVRVMSVDIKTKRLEAVSAFQACAQPGGELGVTSSARLRVLKKQQSHANVLGVCATTGTIVVAYSSPTDPGGIAIGTIGDACSCEEVISHTVNPELQRIQKVLGQLSWSVAELPVPDGSGSFETVIVGPKPRENGFSRAQRVLVLPHGGPHASYSTQFYASVAFYCIQLEAVCLLVNYCGSTGWPEAQLQRLPGRCGELDINQVHQACTTAIEEKLVKSGGKCAVVGGSHGGFIGAHLVAQYPSTYAAAVLRNPVIDIAAMFKVTDIPDWCITSALGCGLDDKYATDLNHEVGDREDNASLREALFKCSPIARVESVKAPCLLHIGERDRRVPPHQGRIWAHALQARGVPVQVRSYPKDSHPISRPRSQAHVVLSTAKFLEATMREA